MEEHVRQVVVMHRFPREEFDAPAEVVDGLLHVARTQLAAAEATVVVTRTSAAPTTATSIASRWCWCANSVNAS